MLTDRPENYTYDVAYSRQCVLLNDFFFKKKEVNQQFILIYINIPVEVILSLKSLINYYQYYRYKTLDNIDFYEK